MKRRFSSTIALTWIANCPTGSRFEVMQTWSLPATADVATIAMSVMPMRGEDDAGGGSAGLWAVTASVGSIPQGVAFFPNGFGETLAHGYGMASGRYPGSGCTMQFAAACGEATRLQTATAACTLRRMTLERT